MGITANSDVGKAADKLLQDRFGKERTSLEKQGESLKKDMDQFRKQAAAMSEDARNKKGRDLQTRIQEFEKKQNDLNQRIAPVQGAVDKQLLEVLSEACSTYAKANGYDLILNYNPSITPFASESVNVSEGSARRSQQNLEEEGRQVQREVTPPPQTGARAGAPRPPCFRTRPARRESAKEPP